MDIEKQKNLIVVVGPTAIGKTGLSIQLAKYYNCEIVSADSRQFYQEMTIGTAKPTPQEMDGIPHHFINNISIHQNYTAGDFEKDAIKILKRLFLKNDTVVLVGGSGLFVNAVCHGLDDIPANPEIRNQLINEFEKNGLENLQKELKTSDPKYFEEADIQNPHRVIRALEVCRTSGKPFSQFLNKQPKKRHFNSIWVGLNLDRETVYDNINSRVDSMIKNGLVNEVKSLEEHKGLTCLKTVGYQEFYQNPDNQEKAIELVKQNTRRFAKRQITFFKRNKEIKWFEPTQLDTIKEHINKNIGL